MTNTIKLVKEFHITFHRRISIGPYIANDKVNKLRLNLLREETNELEEALRIGDKAAVLDALTDIQYILDGSYLELGMHEFKDAAFEEVHKSNMTKLGADGKPMIRKDGKIIKGPNYIEPNLQRFFNDI